MIQKQHNTDEEKKSAALKALDFVQEGMRLGVGTGSTVYYFIEGLAKKGLKVQALPTSKQTERELTLRGIPLLDPEKVSSLDLSVDGADEIDPQFRMIKGGGGALLREKITAKMTRERIVIVDSGKWVAKLGKHPLPVEILPWGKQATEREICQLGLSGTWRKDFTSDNGNPIFDIQFEAPLDSPESWEAKISALPGVLATGFFFQLASRVCVGYPNGEVKIL